MWQKGSKDRAIAWEGWALGCHLEDVTGKKKKAEII
jgi:hypothetical protein